jgi:hypothetical protein
LVQLRSDLEALKDCRIDPSITVPAWHLDPDLREQLDGSIRDLLVEQVVGPGRKILVIGATWPELVVALAQSGTFVTVVDDAAARISAVRDQVQAQSGVCHVTYLVEDYATRSFERASFNAVIAWDILNRYPKPDPIIRKVTRELKTGAELFVRAWVRPPADDRESGLTGALSRIKRRISGGLSSLLKAGSSGAREIPSRAHALDVGELKSTLAEHLVIQNEVPHHLEASDLAELAAMGQDELRRDVAAAMERDKAALVKRPLQARYILFHAADEKQLGSIFKMG